VSAVSTRIPLAEARGLAAEVVDLLAPFCERIEIAGSIRRGRATIGDLEIVALPRLVEERQPDLFGNGKPSTVNLLDQRCDALREQGVFGTRVDKNGRPRWGSGLKWSAYRGVNLDLFGVSGLTAQWGLILLIRTGSADFSHRFVTPAAPAAQTLWLGPAGAKRRHRGWLPPGFSVERGALWAGGALVPTPEETDCFDAVGREFVAPEHREVS